MPCQRKPLALLLTSSLIISSCTSLNTLNSRIRTAQKIASTQQLQAKTVTTPLFTFTTYEKITDETAPLTIYIEGDGLAWLNRARPSGNPTPTNPVALKLAAKDETSENIVYIARPCQYTPITTEHPCSLHYWTSHRFAPEVIDSFDQAIDKIKNNRFLGAVNLVGYSGGGTVATLLAQKRDDIKSLRTVAGNLDIDTFNHIHNVSKMPQSLNPASTARKAKHIPQIHFIGEKDNIVPAVIFRSYQSRAGSSDCIAHQIIPDIDHQNGWDTIWPELMNIPLKCDD